MLEHKIRFELFIVSKINDKVLSIWKIKKKNEEKNNNISTEKACQKKLKNIRKYKVTWHKLQK